MASMHALLPLDWPRCCCTSLFSMEQPDLRSVRSWLAERLGLRAEAAQNGDWWEIDLILVLFFGSVAAGLIALLS